MTRRSRFTLAGAGAFLAYGALLVPFLARAGRWSPLTARVEAYAEVSPDGRAAPRFTVSPASAAATIDGTPADPLAALTPGLHAIGHELSRGGRTSEALHATVLAGPFAADGWARCGARVTLTQRAIDLRVEPIVQALVKSALKEVEDLPGVVTAKVDLGITANGFLVALRIAFNDGTKLEVDSELGLSAAGTRVAVTRIGKVKARIKGPLVDEALDEYVPDAIKKWAPWTLKVIHKVTGRAVRWYAQKLARSKASNAVDLELIPTAMQLLRLPPALAIPDAPGTSVELRFCERAGITLSAGRAITAAFDLRVKTTALPPANAPPGPVLARGAPITSAPALGNDAEVSIDLSLDAVNAGLDGLWRSGALQRLMIDPALEQRLDSDLDPLSFRVRDLALPLPPVVSAIQPGAGGVTLPVAAELAVRLAPRDDPTGVAGKRARVHARMALAVTMGPAPAHELEMNTVPSLVRMTCRQALAGGALRLTACYAGLVSLVALSLESPELLALEPLRFPLDAVLPTPPADAPFKWELERLGLTAPDPAGGWLRLEARVRFRAR